MSDRTPEPIRAPARESKPTPDAAAIPGKRSVGRIMKFAWIRPGFIELMKSDGLSLNRIEVYRIIYTFRKYPEKRRRLSTDTGPRHPFPYSSIYLFQISELLKIRQADIIATGRGDRRNRARKMGASQRTARRCIDDLCRHGYLIRVHPGSPKLRKDFSEYQQIAREQEHEQNPQWWPQKYMVATDRRQRDLLKTLNRKLREANKPPYIRNLKDIQT